jgi:uncharacterized protein
MRVRNLTRGTELGDRIAVAETSQARRTGLLKHTGLDQGEGLWIVPSEGVHCFGMKFDIDVLFLSKKRQVLKVRPRMGRRAISLCLRAHSVLELPAGAIEATATQVGDQLELER